MGLFIVPIILIVASIAAVVVVIGFWLGVAVKIMVRLLKIN